MAETMPKRDMTFACSSILVQVCGSLLKILGVKQRLSERVTQQGG